MNSRLYFNRHQVTDLPELLAKYARDEFASRFRSTVPLLALVTSGSDFLREILQTCGFSIEAALHFEYQVPPGNGRGKASHTDLMVIQNSSAMAIEAKWTEPPSRRVRDWLGPKPTENREKVLSGWLKMIESRTGRTVRHSEVLGLSYQIVHRAASACACAEHAQLAYMEFVSSTHGSTDHRLNDLGRFYAVLGKPKIFPFHMVRIEIETTLKFERLSGLTSPEMAGAVRQYLLAGSLFRFRQAKIETLRPE